MRAQRLQLRAEQEHVARPAVIEGFLAETVPHQVHYPIPAIPEREREHADESLYRVLDPELLKGCEHHFRVGVAAKPMAERLQVLAQLGEVIDLPIEADLVATA